LFFVALAASRRIPIALRIRPVNRAASAFFMKAVLALILVAMLPGCATFDRHSRAPFVGVWLYADQVQSCRYSFSGDGTFHGEVRQNAVVISRFAGRWNVKADALLYTYLSDVFGRIPAGATDRDQVLEVSRDSFLIKAANGERRRYRRIQ
jgi:hypothetical protein